MSTHASARHEPGIERAIETLLRPWMGTEVRVVASLREPYAYSSSHPIQYLEVRLRDGRTIPLLLKATGSRASGLWSMRPAFIDDPQREAEVYREILGPCGISAPSYLGSITLPASALDESKEATWLVLERIRGIELYQAEDFDAWLHAAEWLAQLHARFTTPGGTSGSPEPACLRRATKLLVRDGPFHRQWWTRAVGMARTRNDAEAANALMRVKARFELAVKRVLALPVTFIHGEFYAANVLLRTDREDPEVCPVDWEMASLGTGLIDLAALISGQWQDAQRDAMIDAYRDALPAGLRPPHREFRESLADCRILLAVQWLGWAADWTPPPEQAHDWMAELLSLASGPARTDAHFVSPTGK